MVFLPFRRSASRTVLGFVLVGLIVGAVIFIIGQMHNAYYQHQKFKRFEGYKEYVENVARYMDKVETAANNSDLNMKQLHSLFEQQTVLSNNQLASSASSSTSSQKKIR